MKDPEAVALEIIDTAAELNACTTLVERGEVAPADLIPLFEQAIGLGRDLFYATTTGTPRPPSYGPACIATYAARTRANAVYRGKTGRDLSHPVS
jgi:hypothetical protein